MHPKDVGDRTTLAVMLALRDAGYVVAVPFGENARYDLVIDDGEGLARVQCKTGRFRAGVVIFNTASTYAHHSQPGPTRRVYQGQIDFFGVHCADTGEVYLVPIADAPTRTEAMLRVEPTRNGQRKRVRLASDYLVGSVRLGAFTPEPRASSDARGSCA